MKPGGRQWRKWGLIVFSLLAIAYVTAFGNVEQTANRPHKKHELTASAASIRSKSAMPRAADESHVEIERLNQLAFQHNEEKAIDNVFAVTSWYVPPPPPPPVKPPPPPKPTAPPMPFTYLGVYKEAPGEVIMLVKGERVYTVSVGDVIENTYRVEGMEHGVLEMTYLPLQIRQSIRIGDPS